MKQNTNKVLFIGYGDIASRAAERLSDKGYEVTGVRRRPQAQPTAIKVVAADIFDQEAMDALMQVNWHAVGITLTADHFDAASYQRSYVEGLKAILDAITRSDQSPFVFYTSSTSVYGQSHGEWVDESSPTVPSGFSGQTMLAAEAVLSDSPLPTVAIRFSGIYGGKRQRLLESVRRGELTAEEPVLFSNRIHCDDCAGVIVHLLQQAATTRLAPCYLASDDEPASLFEVTHWLADQLRIPSSQRQALPSRRRSGSKRCRNHRLVESGYQFQYPSYREGYKEAIGRYLQSD